MEGRGLDKAPAGVEDKISPAQGKQDPVEGDEAAAAEKARVEKKEEPLPGKSVDVGVSFCSGENSTSPEES